MASRVTINTETLGIAWVAGQQFRIALQEDFVREVGNTENPNPANANLITFTTNATGPTIAATTPADNTTAATGIVNARLTITFNRKIKVGSGNVQVYQSGSPDVLLLNVPTSDPLISLVDNECRINVTGLMRASTSYYVRVDNGAITDRDGFAFTGINNTTTFNFTTAASTNVLFRDLSANITGAFSPQMIIGVIKKFTANFASVLNAVITVRIIVRPVINLFVVGQVITNCVVVRKAIVSINATAIVNIIAVARKKAQANIVNQFLFGHPRAVIGTVSAAIQGGFVTQQTINEMGNLNLSVFQPGTPGTQTASNTYVYGDFQVVPMPGFSTGQGIAPEGAIFVQLAPFQQTFGVNGILSVEVPGGTLPSALVNGYYKNVPLLGGSGTGATVNILKNPMSNLIFIKNGGQNYQAGNVFNIAQGAMHVGSPAITNITLVTKTQNSFTQNSTPVNILVSFNPDFNDMSDNGIMRTEWGKLHQFYSGINKFSVSNYRRFYLYDLFGQSGTPIAYPQPPNVGNPALAQTRGFASPTKVVVVAAGKAAVYNINTVNNPVILTDPDAHPAVAGNSSYDCRVNNDYCLFINETVVSGSDPGRRRALLFQLNNQQFLQGFNTSEASNGHGLSENGDAVVVGNILYLKPPFTGR